MANQNTLALNLVAQATGVSGPDMENLSGVFSQVVIDITALSGTVPTLTVTVEGKDPSSGKYYTILVSTALATVATTVLKIFPGATAAANLAANDFIPRFYRVSAAIGGTTPAVTAKISVNGNG